MKEALPGLLLCLFNIMICLPLHPVSTSLAIGIEAFYQNAPFLILKDSIEILHIIHGYFINKGDDETFLYTSFLPFSGRNTGHLHASIK